ncbi:MAG: hypothetical protein HMLKMBBP_00387 [Planctomycetes bacterium]|nr:hypothetical protein [Planctomycetota bacterium]
MGGAATIRLERDGPRAVARVAGELTLATTPPLWREVRGVAAACEEIDVRGVPRCDSAGAALLVHLRRESAARNGGRDAPITGAVAQVASMLAIVEDADVHPISPVAPPHEPDDGVFERVGGAAMRLAEAARGGLGYVGDVTASLAQALASPRTVRWKDAFLYMTRAGADALPIVALINVLMGIILAFQGVSLLGKLGFESYTPEAVSVSVVLELGPLMTAILVAGRSGSAFAAEIGTMTVNEEVDALRTMGLDRTRFLVVPKLLALLAMMPLLVVFADACGLLGGLLIGVTALDMTIAQYMAKSFEQLDLWGASQGLIKGEAYALSIAAVSCWRGLRTGNGAQGVGLSATSAVVSSIFLIIVCDAVLTVVFHYV